MKLEELKQMVAEEFTAYKKTIKEQPAGGPGTPPPPGAPDLPGISVSDNDVDATGGGNAEDTLQKVFDILSDYFESDDAEADTEAEDDEDAEDVADVEDDEEDEEEEDIEEALTNHGLGKAAANSTGENVGYKKVSESRKRKKANKVLAEAKMKARFKKLANI